jgi:hypothetical protein
VIATLGMTGWRRVLFGSVAERVVRLAKCPVLTIRAPQGCALADSRDLGFTVAMGVHGPAPCLSSAKTQDLIAISFRSFFIKGVSTSSIESSGGLPCETYVKTNRFQYCAAGFSGRGRTSPLSCVRIIRTARTSRRTRLAGLAASRIRDHEQQTRRACRLATRAFNRMPALVRFECVEERPNCGLSFFDSAKPIGLRQRKSPFARRWGSVRGQSEAFGVPCLHG